MSETYEALRQMVQDAASEAGALDKALAKLDGRLPGLVVAQLTVAADKFLRDVRRMADTVSDATPRGTPS